MFDTSAADRTERPTQRRRRDARADGLVARSSELVTSVRSLALWVVIASWGATFLTESASLVRSTLARPPSNWLTSAATELTREPTVWAATQLTMPLLVITAFVAFAHFAQTGWLWQPQRVLPDASRLSPISGLGRIVTTAIPRTIVLLTKTVFILSLSGWLLVSDIHTATRTSSPSAAVSSDNPQANDWNNRLTPLRRFTLVTSLSLLAWGLLDYFWQRRRFEQSLRMTKAEVRRELKETSRRAEHRQGPWPDQPDRGQPL